MFPALQRILSGGVICENLLKFPNVVNYRALTLSYGKHLTYSTNVKNGSNFGDAAAVAQAKADGTAIATCTPTLRTFSVLVKHALEPNELVGLTGDHKSLGSWRLEDSVALKKKGESGNEWSASVMLQSCEKINYRYFTYVQDQNHQKHIRLWESHLKPRTLDACQTNCRLVDVFGENSNGEVQLNRGWITQELIYQFKFERERMFHVHDIEKFDPENVWIKLVPLQEDLETPMDTKVTAVNVEVVKMSNNESLLQQQPSMGVPHKRNEVVIFHVTVPKMLVPAFALVFHSAKDQLPMGKTVIVPSSLQGSEGELELSIRDATADTQSNVVARLKLPYLVVKPFTEVDILDFRTTYAHYWPKSWPILDVGHRGNGKSYIANPPKEVENTVASFLKAYEVFADMIELDVHLTSDGIPVIYHDFGLRTAPHGKEITEISQLEYVLIKDITYDELCALRVFAVINNEIKEYTSHNAEPIVERRIFPRLVDVLEALPKTLGIDVEIKWPQRKQCGGVEAEQTIDKNFFINRVLEIIIHKGCGRPLIFSSFDADICTMLRFKQNIFPVMFLSMGETKKWEPFLDLRTRTFQQAVNNAQAFELAGTAPHAEDFINNDLAAGMMQRARSLGQIALVWGDDCNSKEAVKYFHTIGATATCYDRSDLYMPDNKERSFFNSSMSLQEFQGQCRPN
ncbi:glycerophosphocholine phosphodiesterase GPCPD1 isoform X2 [Stomoxys calcitrans]|uniref:glycerophosphocholine phosphodiesterase GPCPD1 isoform X2 n=1 Tax=Stomoxys calcitrans TaxID=35570 RepID=UPI0027E32E34|nr:glycerophosphocholine phosphodiesterase GPCPD1 isoform X2 [Stomoxys calcitrans]